MEILRKGIADSEQVILDQASYCGMWEEPDKHRAAIGDFISCAEYDQSGMRMVDPVV